MAKTSTRLQTTALILLLLTIGTVTAFAAPPDYFITCDPDSFDYIYENWSEDIYIPMTLTHNGITWPDCRVRIRGDTSREEPKKSLRVKFDGAPFINGRDVILFNADYSDQSYMSTVLSTRLFHELGYPCFEAEHARLHLNGEFFGLYIRVENMDENALMAKGMDPTGNLYKATTDGATLSIYDTIYDLWEKKTNEAGPWDDLAELRDQINEVSDEDYHTWTQTAFDYDRMLDMITGNWWICNGSTYYHNYYMYHDINGSGQWWMMPWDLDKTIYKYGGYTYHLSSKHSLPDNPFIERAIIDDTIFADLKTRAYEIQADIYNEAHMFPIMDSLAVEIAASVAQDQTDDVADSLFWVGRVDYAKYILSYFQNYLPTQLEEFPRSFNTERTPYAFTDQVTLRWRSSTDPQGDPLEYTVRYCENRWWTEAATVYYEGLTDTTFTLPVLPAVGSYYWQVFVEDNDGDSHAYVEGFDSYNIFEVRGGSTLPASITTTMTLDAAGSPWIANGDVVIENGAVLNVEPGVEIRMPQDSCIYVYGEIQVNGTAGAPVHLMPRLDATTWGAVILYHGSGQSNFEHLLVDGATLGPEYWHKAAITSMRTDMDLSHVTFRNCLASLYSYEIEINITDCVFEDSNTGEMINNVRGTSIIERCSFTNTTAGGDAIDFDRMVDGVIRDCEFAGSEDDLIDIGLVSTALVEGNLIRGAADKGISVGEQSEVQIQYNIVVDCVIGIAVKDSAVVDVDHVTLYGNTTAIECYEKNVGAGGGEATITNTIFSQNGQGLLVDEFSAATVDYSLSDQEPLTGIDNLQGDPLLSDPLALDFNLDFGSPCIDTGDPSAPLDPDDSRTDMGALYFDLTRYQVVINEINYHPADDFDTEDWVEFHNPTEVAADISGMQFKDSDNAHVFVFPEGTVLAPGGYLVLCENLTAFKALFPLVDNCLGDMPFGLSGGGELIRFFDLTDNLVDLVEYDDAPPWPTEPDGFGPTLELIDPMLDNSLPESWRASAGHGTPGDDNIITAVDHGDGTQIPTAPVLARAFPNPFNPMTRIRFGLDARRQVEVAIYDVSGRRVKLLADRRFEAGWYDLVWEGDDDSGKAQSSGLYFVQLNAEGSFRQSQKLLLLK